MAVITTYSNLLTEVSTWLARGDNALLAAAPSFVQNFEADFYRDPRNHGRWMEVADDPVIASSVITVPADYLALKYAYVSGSPSSRLDRVSINQLYGRYPRGSDTGLPEWIAREAGNFVFGPAPDFTYTIHRVYWGKPTALRNASADAAAHYLITDAPDLCLFGSLLQAEPFIKNDARIPVWQGMYDRALQSYRRLQRDEEQAGSPSQEVLA
jgi:hypothetical protein